MIRSIHILFRWISLAALLAAGALNFAARWSHTRAWNAFTKFLHEPPPESPSMIAIVACVGPWLVAAAIQAATIRKQSLLMDCCRVVSLMAAWMSISISWSDIQFWWPIAAGPFGDGLPSGDFDSWLDVYLSYPVCFVSLLAFGMYKWHSWLDAQPVLPANKERA